MSKLVNSSAGNTMFNVAGAALSDTIQPDLDGGAIAGNSTAEIASPINGYRPSNLNPITLEQSGTEKIAVQNVSIVTTESRKINQVYKVRSLLQASGIRNNHFNFQSGVWDSGHPVAHDDTEEIQINTSLSTDPQDDAIGGLNEVVYKYGLNSPTQVDING